MNVRGTQGTLKEYNDAHGGPMAYLGSTVPGFPNFFMMEGMSRLVYLNASLLTLLRRVPLVQVQILSPAIRLYSFPKRCRFHTFYNSSSPCAPEYLKAWRPPTPRRIGTTTCCRSVSKTLSGRSACRGTESAAAGGSRARSRVRSCCSGGGYGGFVGRITRSMVLV